MHRYDLPIVTEAAAKAELGERYAAFLRWIAGQTCPLEGFWRDDYERWLRIERKGKV